MKKIDVKEIFRLHGTTQELVELVATGRATEEEFITWYDKYMVPAQYGIRNLEIKQYLLPHIKPKMYAVIRSKNKRIEDWEQLYTNKILTSLGD